MQAKKTAIGAVAIASSFVFSSAAQANLLNLFGDRSSVIQNRAIVQPCGTNACCPTQVVTRAAVVRPIEVHELIRAVPATIDCPAFGNQSLIRSPQILEPDLSYAEPAVSPSLIPAIAEPSAFMSALPLATDPTVMPAFPALDQVAYNNPTFAAVVESNVGLFAGATTRPTVLQGAPVGGGYCGSAYSQQQLTFPAVIEPYVNQAAPVCPTCPTFSRPAVIRAPYRGISYSPTTNFGQTCLPAVIPALQPSRFERFSLRETSWGLNQADRLVDMWDQVKLGECKGWLTSSELAGLTCERDRIAQLINTYAPQGLTQCESDQLDVALTVFNQRIVGELNNHEGAVASSSATHL